MQVFPHIHLLGGVGFDSNVYLIDNQLMVDAGTGVFFKQLKDELSSNFQLDKFKTLVNTHCHFDHVGGNKKFRDWLKVKIATHQLDKEVIERGGKQTLASLFGESPKSSTVDITLDDNSVLETEHFTFLVIPTPGHTPGSICLYEPDKKLLFSGDTIFADGLGRTDLAGGNKGDLFLSLKKLSQLRINALLPGHGAPKFSGVNFLVKQFVNKWK